MWDAHDFKKLTQSLNRKKKEERPKSNRQKGRERGGATAERCQVLYPAVISPLMPQRCLGCPTLLFNSKYVSPWYFFFSFIFFPYLMQVLSVFQRWYVRVSIKISWLCLIFGDKVYVSLFAKASSIFKEKEWRYWYIGVLGGNICKRFSVIYL